jgi:Raf kinase inhibitor-like YbhB/YbcL family protein
MIPKQYTADGENVSPPLSWSRGPTDTREYVLIVEDADSGGSQPTIHWMVFGIPASTTSLPEGASGRGDLIQGVNYKGDNKYSGPDPEPGKVHHYFFQVFALNSPTNLAPGADKKAVAAALAGGGKVWSKGELVGIYQRPTR